MRVVEKSVHLPTKQFVSERVTITPYIAESWLTKNVKNRRISTTAVNRYARDMKAGKWKFSGDAIRFSVDGDLLDGQHRLLACIKSGEAFETLVMYNISADTRQVIDGGMARTAKDYLTFDGYHNASTLAASVVYLVTYRTGGDRRKDAPSMSTQELSDMVRHHKTLPASVNLCASSRVVGASLMAFVHYCAAELLNHRDKANEFAAVFTTGIPSRPGCPAHAARSTW